jgi:S-DNA-T family DNA segregation ATPase FtsK/SpoIIIE
MNENAAAGANAPDITSPSGKTALKRAGLSIGAIAAGAYALGAVLTYSPEDPSLNTATNDAPINLFGGPGALLADLLVQSFGAAAALGATALLGAGVLRFARRRWMQPIPRERLMAGAAGVALLGGAASSAPVDNVWGLAAGNGGMIGDGIAGLLSMIYSLPALPGAEILGGLTALGAGAAGLLWAFSVTKDDMRAAADLTANAAGKAAGAGKKAANAVLLRLRGEPGLQDPARQIAGAPNTASLTPVDAIADDVREDDQGPRYALNAPTHPVEAPAPYASPQQREARAEPAPAPIPNIAPMPPRPAAPAPAPTYSKAPAPAPTPYNVTSSFNLPQIELLAAAKARAGQTDGQTLQTSARQLAAVLADFGVQGEIVSARPGPVVTLFELEPAPGVKSSRVIGLAEDIARSMSAERCRVAVIPGRNAIGIELPNVKREMVFLRSLLASTSFVGAQGALPLALGETIEGEPFSADLAKMPHLLMAGTTGSGKSVGINAMILSLLYRHSPEECRFIMIDPKMLELSIYEGIPHLLSPVVTDPKKAVVALKWTVREMEERYRRMAKLGVRNIQGYNERLAAAAQRGEKLERTTHVGFDPATGEPIYETQELPNEPMPFIVVVIDEMADLMLTAGKEIEAAVQRLAQMARAAGIHVIMATQRPSVDVITGTIKANFPTRISYQVSSKIDSRTILGEQGAEQLLGHGDLLFMAGGGRIRRLHGPYVSDEEVQRVVDMLRAQGAPVYRTDVTEDPDEEVAPPADLLEAAGMSGDDLYDRAVELVVHYKRASTSFLQRHLRVGYNRAATIIERMEREGVVSPDNGAGKRDVMISSLNNS